MMSPKFGMVLVLLPPPLAPEPMSDVLLAGEVADDALALSPLSDEPAAEPTPLPESIHPLPLSGFQSSA